MSLLNQEKSSSTSQVDSQKLPNTTSYKDKEGKPRADLLIEYFPRALMEVSKVCSMGSKKYGEFTWQNVPIRDFKGALCRHLLQAEGALLRDEESNLPHYAHLAWNALVVLELELRKVELFK